MALPWGPRSDQSVTWEQGKGGSVAAERLRTLQTMGTQHSKWIPFVSFLPQFL